MLLHLMQDLRRQTLLDFFWSLELTTFVSLPQYIHTMSIYCHNASESSSGKLPFSVGKSTKKLQINDLEFIDYQGSIYYCGHAESSYSIAWTGVR